MHNTEALFNYFLNHTCKISTIPYSLDTSLFKLNAAHKNSWLHVLSLQDEIKVVINKYDLPTKWKHFKTNNIFKPSFLQL